MDGIDLGVPFLELEESVFICVDACRTIEGARCQNLRSSPGNIIVQKYGPVPCPFLMSRCRKNITMHKCVCVCAHTGARGHGDGRPDATGCERP